MNFPTVRHRRLRNSAAMRSLVRENYLHVNDLIAPIFVIYGEGVKNEIPSMPGVYQWSIDRLEEEVDEEELTQLDNTESVLEAAMKVYQPFRRLRWHYRSKHESLIRFSNS